MLMYIQCHTAWRAITNMQSSFTMQSTDAVYNIQHKTCEVHSDYPQLYLNQRPTHTCMGLSAHSNLLDPLDQSIQFHSHCLLVFKMQSANWCCYLLCRHLWVVVYSWVRGWLLFCLRFRFLGNSVTCVFCPSGLKQRLDPRALGGMTV